MLRQHDAAEASVNPITNEVKADEGNIQFCINGIKVEAIDVQALSPKDIIRVNTTIIRVSDTEMSLPYWIISSNVKRRKMFNLNLSNSPSLIRKRPGCHPPQP
ncbi:MAG: hypothetical protein V8T12_09520 [Parabacteroides johnsonii]